MNFYQFASESPFLTFIIVLIVCCTISDVVKFICNRNKPKDEDNEE